MHFNFKKTHTAYNKQSELGVVGLSPTFLAIYFEEVAQLIRASVKK